MSFVLLLVPEDRKELRISFSFFHCCLVLSHLCFFRGASLRLFPPSFLIPQQGMTLVNLELRPFQSSNTEESHIYSSDVSFRTLKNIYYTSTYSLIFNRPGIVRYYFHLDFVKYFSEQLYPIVIENIPFVTYQMKI